MPHPSDFAPPVTGQTRPYNPASAATQPTQPASDQSAPTGVTPDAGAVTVFNQLSADDAVRLGTTSEFGFLNLGATRVGSRVVVTGPDLIARNGSHDTLTSNVTFTATSEGTSNTIITGSTVTSDGGAPFFVQFFAPGLENTSTDSFATLFLVLLRGPEGGSASVIVGKWCNADYSPEGGGTNINAFPWGDDQRYPVMLGYQDGVLAAGNYFYQVNAYGTWTGGSVKQARVVAGAGGSGNIAQGYLRVTTDF